MKNDKSQMTNPDVEIFHFPFVIFHIFHLSFLGQSRSSTVERQAYTLQAADYRVIRVRISAGLLGPEAHRDEFSTFNREVVGSTPTRPMKNCGLMIADCGLPMASSIPAAGTGGESYGEDSSDRHRDKAPALRGVAQQGACAKAHSDQEISSRLDSSDGRAPIS